MNELTLIQDQRPIADIVAGAIFNIVEGNVDPMQAYAFLTRYERAIAEIKDNPRVKDIMLNEIAKYGKAGAVVGDLLMTQAEAGVKYDYSNCGCSELAELTAQKASIEQDIKQLEKVLKAMPVGGMADPNSGEIWFPPVKSSKTIIKATIKK